MPTISRAVGLACLLVATSARPMGAATTFELVAWNGAGTDALVMRTQHPDVTTGGSETDYLVVSGIDKVPVRVFTFTNTRDPDDNKREQIDRAACENAAANLARVAAAKRFAGVAVHGDRCGSNARDVVAIADAAAQQAALSWIARANVRAPSAREAAAQSVANKVIAELGASASVHQDAELDLAATSGKLVLVFFGENGSDDKAAGQLAAYRATKDGYEAVIYRAGPGAGAWHFQDMRTVR